MVTVVVGAFAPVAKGEMSEDHRVHIDCTP